MDDSIGYANQGVGSDVVTRWRGGPLVLEGKASKRGGVIYSDDLSMGN